jgi:chromate transporter
MNASSPSPAPYSHWRLIRYFLWLGSVGYGGPLALMGYMRRDLSEKREWISHSDFLNGVALSSLCPGPLATQLSIYIGWFRGRIVGATAALIAFTLPAFLMVLTLAVLYKHSVQINALKFAFYGVSASVLAIIIRHAYQMSKKIVEKDHWLWGVFIYNFLITSMTHLQVYWAFLLSGLLVWLIKSPPRFLSFSLYFIPFSLSLESLSNNQVLSKLFLYFAWAGTVVFGGGFAIIPFIHEGVVHHYHWLTERQFLDALAVGMVTPGPLVLVVTFMGYLIAGIKGAVVATIGILLPCYLLVILLAPHFNRIAHHAAVKAFVRGITVAVAGGIAGTTLILAQSVLNDWATFGIFASTALGLLIFRKIPEPVWLVIAACAGIAVKGLGS